MHKARQGYGQHHASLLYPTPSVHPLCSEGELVTRVSLHRGFDASATKLSVLVRNRAQRTLRRGVRSRSEADIVNDSIAGDLAIIEANILGRVLENGALDEDLCALASIDAVGEDTVVVA